MLLIVVEMHPHDDPVKATELGHTRPPSQAARAAFP